MFRKRHLLMCLPPGILLALWAIVGAGWPPLISWLRVHSPEIASTLPDLTFLSTPTQALLAIWHLTVGGNLTTHVLCTFTSTSIAFAVAVIIGVSGGIVLARVPAAETALMPSIEAMRSIPPIALLPIFILIAGIGWKLPVAFGTFGGMWPMLIAAHAAIQGLDPVRLDVARNLRLSRRDILLHVVIPLAAPQVLTGLRITLPITLILVIVAEMFVGGGNGLGAEIDFARRSFRFADMMALICVIGLLGLLLNKAMAVVARRLAWWAPEYQWREVPNGA